MGFRGLNLLVLMEMGEGMKAILFNKQKKNSLKTGDR